MKPNGKCFAKKCEDCKWLNHWNLTNQKTQETKIEQVCSFRVLMDEIPRIIGAMDGLQGGVNQARNSSKAVKNGMGQFIGRLMEGGNGRKITNN